MATAKVRPLLRPVEARPEPRVVEPQVRMFPTGCALLDLQNGGGWVLGRMVNVVGDSSTGKTGIAVEAAANFALLYGPEAVRYVETEAAFDESYAEQLGLPRGIERTDEVRTVEDFNDDLSAFLKRLKAPAGLYVLDSVDALSSQAEAGRSISDKSTYATEKAKVLSELFRRQVSMIAEKNVCLFLVSQTRDNIGNFFVPKVRSGGRALDFYSSQTVWLSELSREKRTVSGVERTIGINVRCQNKKNKVGEPYRSVDLLIVFNYGVDDELSMIEWLKRNKADEAGLLVPLDKYAMAVRRARDKRDAEELLRYTGNLRAATRARWNEIEDALRPPMRKYEVS
jgi:RecA/RadA recombinase